MASRGSEQMLGSAKVGDLSAVKNCYIIRLNSCELIAKNDGEKWMANNFCWQL